MSTNRLSPFRLLALFPVLAGLLIQCCLPDGAVWYSGKRESSGTG